MGRRRSLAITYFLLYSLSVIVCFSFFRHAEVAAVVLMGATRVSDDVLRDVAVLLRKRFVLQLLSTRACAVACVFFFSVHCGESTLAVTLRK